VVPESAMSCRCPGCWTDDAVYVWDVKYAGGSAECQGKKDVLLGRLTRAVRAGETRHGQPRKE
jgi:hypothetical protein